MFNFPYPLFVSSFLYLFDNVLSRGFVCLLDGSWGLSNIKVCIHSKVPPQHRYIASGPLLSLAELSCGCITANWLLQDANGRARNSYAAITITIYLYNQACIRIMQALTKKG